jgi:predicted Zn-dependent protease
VGVENYLLSLKPAPVRWFLHLTGAQTDKETGLRKLRITAALGHYLQPYARMLLAVAALRDHQPDEARKLLEGLSRDFPQNRLYASELAKLMPPDQGGAQNRGAQ